MTLAEELMGLRPRVTLRGKIVSHDDVPPPYATDATQKADAWLKTVGDFTLYDVCDGLNLTAKQASGQIRRWRGQERVLAMGMKKIPGNRLRVWRRV